MEYCVLWLCRWRACEDGSHDCPTACCDHSVAVPVLFTYVLEQNLYSCGGSNITRRVRRALAQTFSIRGCRMLGLCSCYDLSDFLANLLQQFANEDNDVGRISLQSLRSDEEPPREISESELLLLPTGAEPRRLKQSNRQPYSLNSLGAARRALTDKVVAARVLFRKMIVAEVGSREPGRYGGLSIYFPDPDMAVRPYP